MTLSMADWRRPSFASEGRNKGFVTFFWLKAELFERGADLGTRADGSSETLSTGAATRLIAFCGVVVGMVGQGRKGPESLSTLLCQTARVR